MSIFKRFRRPGPDETPAGPAFVEDPAMLDLEVAAARDFVVRTGRFEPAAQMLEQIGSNWDRRSLCAQTLADSVLKNPAWFVAWTRAQPDSADRLVVEAQVAVNAAWEARGSGWARDTSSEAFAEFARILEHAEHACLLACEAAPQDPTPWITRLWVTIGRGAPREVFEARWSELLARDPHSRFGHNSALQYLAAKWYGSHEEMYAFARKVAAAAPAGSPLALLVLQAHVEYQLRENDRDSDFDIDAFWSHPERRADVDAALAAYPKDGAGRNPTWLHDLSILTFALAMSDRWIDLAVQFAGANNSVYEYPWYHTSRGFLAEAFRNAQEAVAPHRD
ncbi:DUF4034 domain-containing protein [Embleya sp. NPDC008237]|uniref:DUF4034 domain-containing protein n=1 Tax=Embleya sp. NPDC008237 TaxID=3363978 RepID=UPI0036E2B844